MIALKKMTPPEFEAYLKVATPKYAEDKVKEGLTPEDALRTAEESFRRLLPEGLRTQSQFLYSVIEDSSSKAIGILWLGRRTEGSRQFAFIYDIELEAAYRGQGYGKQLMALLEAEVKGMGLTSIGLHVFGHNEPAIALYQKTGFRTTNLVMYKDLK